MEIATSSSSNKLKLSSKRLKSGKLQVKFELSGISSSISYGGYLLTEPKTPLKEVVLKIFNSFNQGQMVGYHRHLYDVGKAKQSTEMLIIR